MTKTSQLNQTRPRSSSKDTRKNDYKQSYKKNNSDSDSDKPKKHYQKKKPENDSGSKQKSDSYKQSDKNKKQCDKNKGKQDHKKSSKPKRQADPDVANLHKQPVTRTGLLRGKLADQHEDGSFYAKFGDKPCVCTPMSKTKNSEN
jgi:hypothetical protein